MNHAVAVWLILALMLCSMALVAVWSRRSTIARAFGALVLLPAILISGGALGSALGFPIPYWPGITIGKGKVTVLGFKVDRGKAVYILIDGNPPRYYQLPYNARQAQALQDAKRQAGKKGTVKATVGEGDQGDFVPWPVPQPPLPPKYQSG